MRTGRPRSIDRISGIELAKLAATQLDCGFIMVGNGEFTLVDKADQPWLSKFAWYVAPPCPYVVANIRHKTVYMGRLILGLVDPKQECDHINRCKLDNRRINLRICTRVQNCGNRLKPRGQFTSNFKGVSKNSRSGRWRARGKITYKNLHIGEFDTELEAARAYNEWATKHFGEFAYLNQI